MTLISLWRQPREEDRKPCAFQIPEKASEPDGKQMKVYVTPFEYGNAEETMTFAQDVRRLYRLKSVTTNGDDKLRLLSILLYGDALAQFEALFSRPALLTALTQPDEAQRTAQNAANLNTAVDVAFATWMINLLPNQCGRTIKEELRTMRKPQSMEIGTYMARIKEINNMIPHGLDNQTAYNDADLMQIVEDNIPLSWKNALRMKADYTNLTWRTMLAYLKLLESMHGQQDNRRAGNAAPRTSNSGRGRRNDRRRGYRNRRGYGGPNGGDDNRGSGGGGGRGPGGGGSGSGSGGRGQGRGNAGRGQQQQQHQQQGEGGVRRSQRFRSQYCPTCRTREHDGTTCPTHQHYLSTRNQRNQEAHQLETTNEEIHMLTIDDESTIASTIGGGLQHDVHVLDQTWDELWQDEDKYCQPIMDAIPAAEWQDILTIPTEEQQQAEAHALTRRITTSFGGEPSGVLQIRVMSNPTRKLYGLLDSGASLSLVSARVLPKDTQWHPVTSTTVRTKTGSFMTKEKANLQVMFPEFSSHRIVAYSFYRDEALMTTSGHANDDFVLGRDFLMHTGISMDWGNGKLVWDDLEIPMPIRREQPELFAIKGTADMQDLEHPQMETAKFTMTTADVSTITFPST